MQYFICTIRTKITHHFLRKNHVLKINKEKDIYKKLFEMITFLL